MVQSQSLRRDEAKSRRHRVHCINDESLDGFTPQLFGMSTSCKENLGTRQVFIYMKDGWL